MKIQRIVSACPPEKQAARLAWEEVIGRYRLFWPQPSPPERRVIDNTRFPPMAPVYMAFIDEPTDPPPTADTFEDAFFAEHNWQRTDAVRWRLRAKFYPSFVAQQHLTLILMERFQHVTWSTSEDMRGIDIHLAYRGLALGIASALGSNASKDWQRIKAQRNPASGHVWLLHLYRRPDEYAVGPFWLHNPDIVESEIKTYVASVTSGAA